MKNILSIAMLLFCMSVASANINPNARKKKASNVSVRMECQEGSASAIQNINNVRSTLLSSGDVWWDLQNGSYFIPNTPPEIEDVSSLFAGAVWIGGYEPVDGDNDILKIAATTFRPTEGTDFYPGPLSDDTGTIDQEGCNNWDRFFTVRGREIDLHRLNYIRYKSQGKAYPLDSIPENIRYWPGVGNSQFILEYGFQLPEAGQGLGSFYDHPDSQLDIYDPENGDFPSIEVRGCEQFPPQYPDEMHFWIYNDQGGPHTSTAGAAIQMEIQVQSFAYESNDALNDMTFQRYKLINRAQTVIKDCYFAMWVDGDLGCGVDDYIGCDTSRSLAYLYNQDEIDGDNGCDCSVGGGTYCSDVPILGVDYFRGPLKPLVFNDEGVLVDMIDPFDTPDDYVEIGMSSFVYTNNPSIGDHPPGTWDPETALEHYNLLDGKWRDGVAISFGASGYNVNGSQDTIRYVLPGAPSNESGWSMCSADLGFGDRRTIQASGPFILKQGAINELIIGVVWVPNQVYPCPELGDLNKADDLAQALFDNCFETLDGPDGPDVDIVELDREIIIMLTNDTLLSNNQYESYSEFDIFATDSIAKKLDDSLKMYEFEGYVVYQLLDPTASSNLSDIERARVVRQVDIKNGITTLYNWNSETNPLPEDNELFYTPERKIIAADKGVQHSFSLKEDAFDQGDSRLVNHREYYYYVIAYGHNQYLAFNPSSGLGQQRPFIAGRRTYGVVTAVPRPMVYDELSSYFGDGPIVTRLQGVGNQGLFAEMNEEMYERILTEDIVDEIVYKDGAGPLKIHVVNPLDVKDGKFRLEIDGNYDNDSGKLLASEDSKWSLKDLTNGKTYHSYESLEKINERILKDYGFSMTIHRNDEISNKPTEEQSGGFVGAKLVYENPLGSEWLQFLPAGGFTNFNLPAYNFIESEFQKEVDPTGDFSTTDGLNMIPYKLADFAPGLITPGLRSNSALAGNVQKKLQMSDLNNVDIVFTSDRSKWSKCIVVETSHEDFYDAGYSSDGQSEQMQVRDQPSLLKETDGLGAPQYDASESGYSWFPGYAVDIESGIRLNIFFGENSCYGGDYVEEVGGDLGRDMIWNPDGRLFLPTPMDKDPSIWDLYTGGQHTIYVSRTPYDECRQFRELLDKDAKTSQIIKSLQWITWSGIPMINTENGQLESYENGLIPQEAIIMLRVDQGFGKELDFVDNEFLVKDETECVFEIVFQSKQAVAVDETTIEDALTHVNVVPNPYYGASSYEVNQNDNRVKITNVPAHTEISIYSLDGRFIAQYLRDAKRQRTAKSTAAINFSQEGASIVWNLKNTAGIPVSSGVYLVHVLDVETGAERTIKWFGVNRKFDPSGL